MIGIYSTFTSSRLHYICSFIFEELMQTEFFITSNKEIFIAHTGARIFYSSDSPFCESLSIIPHSLLSENTITNQHIECFLHHGYTAFFGTGSNDIPFDILSASFYLVSRYEEYLPHKKDLYGRYAHENSLAFRQGFLHLPLINIWVKDLAIKLRRIFPEEKINFPSFRFIPTYDIDIAYSYKYKGALRNIGGFIKKPSAGRIGVLSGFMKDPFDVYEELNTLHIRYRLEPVFFFLMASQNGDYDKNILPETKAMQKLISYYATNHTIGIHPSWQSAGNHALLKEEKDKLASISKTNIYRSRQHYIQFNLPEGYRYLLSAGITNDYSMGYGSINGFRASVATDFYWYDLEKEIQTSLKIHPFCFMEANSLYEQKQAPESTLTEILRYYNVCRENAGTFITVFHNHLLGRNKPGKEWMEMYKTFLQTISLR